MSIRGLA